MDRPKAFAASRGRPLLAESLERLEASELDRRDRRRRARGLGGARDPRSPKSWAAARSTRAVAGGRAGPSRCGSAWPRWTTTRPCMLVHDAARPLLPEDVLERVLAALGRGLGRCRAGTPVADTIKRVRAVQSSRRSRAPSSSPSRRRRRSSRSVLRAALDGDIASASDCASLVEARGGRVTVVEGDRGS